MSWSINRTSSYTMLSLIGCSFLAITGVETMPKKIVWNASASVPIGLYRVIDRTPKKGEIVLVWLPDWAAYLANRRHYLPQNTPAIKRISAGYSDVVCRLNFRIMVNNVQVAKAQSHDSHGRRMPIWESCFRLGEDEVFLLTDHPNSFDGRYVGITKLSKIIGVVEPVWLIAD